jgi:hypothetical protein
MKRSTKLNSFLKLFGVLIFFFTSSLLIQSQINFFLGSDSYYHVAHSQLLVDSTNWELVKPWVKFHFFTDFPVDPYFLFHKLNSFAINLAGIVLGSKMFISLLTGITFSTFYFVLVKYKISYPFIWSLLLGVSSAYFSFKFLLIRSYVLAPAFLLIIYYLLDQKKYLAVTTITGLFMLYYGMGFTALILASCFLLADFINKQQIDWDRLLAVLVGLLIGISLHPSSFNYLQYLYVQYGKFFLLKFSNVPLTSGKEINLSGLSSLVKNLLPVGIFLISIAAFFEYYLNQKKLTKFLPLFLFTSFWFLIFLIWPRGINYWLPFSLLFAAILYSKINLPQKINKFKQPVAIVLISISIITGGYNFYQIFSSIKQHNNSNELKQTNQVAKFLQENTPKNSTLFYSRWSYFPELFYFNKHNKYLFAFGSIFTYQSSPKKYYLRYNFLKNGESCNKRVCLTSNFNNYSKKVTKLFNKKMDADYIVTKTNNKIDGRVEQILTHLPNFQQIYSNKNYKVFKIKEPTHKGRPKLRKTSYSID